MALLLVQMAVVLLVTLACGTLARKLGQARVIGEIIGGIFLGPSLLGRFAPHAYASLFPAASLGSFDILTTMLNLLGVEDRGRIPVDLADISAA